MSQIKYHIFIFIACFSTLLSAQQDSIEDKDMLLIRLQSYVDQAKLDSDRGNYFSSTDNLNKALEIAEKIEDKSNQGKILTKIAKVQYLGNKPNQANLSISKALKIQREIEDYGSQAIAYNLKGVFHSNKKIQKCFRLFYICKKPF